MLLAGLKWNGCFKLSVSLIQHIDWYKTIICVNEFRFNSSNLVQIVVYSNKHYNENDGDSHAIHPLSLPPQTKFVKVMFLHVSFILSTGGGVVVSQHALQVYRPTPRGEVEGSGLGVSTGPHPGGKLRGLAWAVSPGPHPCHWRLSVEAVLIYRLQAGSDGWTWIHGPRGKTYPTVSFVVRYAGTR